MLVRSRGTLGLGEAGDQKIHMRREGDKSGMKTAGPRREGAERVAGAF